MADENKLLPAGVAKGTIRDNLELVCFALPLILFFKTFVGQQFVIPSASMRNTLMIGDHLLANKFIFAAPQWDWEAKLFPMRKAERGDIIVFRYPMNRDQDYVKRCVALAGDTLAVGAWGEDSAATGVNGNQADNSVGLSGAVDVYRAR